LVHFLKTQCRTWI